MSFTPCCGRGVWYLSTILYDVTSRNLHIYLYYNFFHGFPMERVLARVRECLAGRYCFLVGTDHTWLVSCVKQQSVVASKDDCQCDAGGLCLFTCVGGVTCGWLTLFLPVECVVIVFSLHCLRLI